MTEYKAILNELAQSRIEIAKIDTKITSFVQVHNSDMERLSQKINDNKEILQNQIQKAFNNQKTITDKLEKIENETEEVRVKHKFPDIKQGMTVFNIIKSIGIILVALAFIISLYINYLNIITK